MCIAVQRFLELSIIYMKKFGLVFLAIVVVVVLIYWFFLRDRADKLSDEDQLALAQDSGQAGAPAPQDSVVFPDTPVGNQLRDHMMVVALPAETIEEADAKYNSSLGELKKNMQEAISLLNDAYEKTDARHYFNRWGIVKTLGDLQNAYATGPLAKIALSQIPQETSKDLHHFSSQEEEVVIRIRAIEGLGLIAKSGDKAADETLLRIALDSANQNSAMQLRAIKAYLRAGKNTDERIRSLKSRLNTNMHDVITIAVTNPDEFVKNMESIKKLSEEKTKSESFDRKRERQTSSPKAKNN